MVRGPLTVNLPFMPFASDMSGWALIYLGVLQKWGVAMFEGGTGGFPAALIRCLEAHGGRVRCSAPVEELIVRGGRVCGVALDGGEEARGEPRGGDRVRSVDRAQQDAPGRTPARADRERRPGNPDDARPGGGTRRSTSRSRARSRYRSSGVARSEPPGDPVDLRLPCVTWSTHEQSLIAGEAAAEARSPR